MALKMAHAIFDGDLFPSFEAAAVLVTPIRINGHYLREHLAGLRLYVCPLNHGDARSLVPVADTNPDDGDTIRAHEAARLV